jgi:hypothetical protein
MNILIENDGTLEYLTSSGKWTKNPRAGRRFQVTDEAVQVAKLEPIGSYTIVRHIPMTNQFINLDHGRGRGLPEAGAK